MLSNFQAGGYPLLQIFLLGQPEFRERLARIRRLEQLRQRVIAMHHLDPMEAGRGRALSGPPPVVVGWHGQAALHQRRVRARCTAGRTACRAGSTSLPGRVLLFGAIEQIDTLRRARDAGGGDRRSRQRYAGGRRARSRAAAAAEPLELRDVAPMVDGIADAAPPVEPIRSPSRSRPPERATVDASTARIAALEARLEEQDAALRRVLTLLVDWVEGERRPSAAPIRRRRAA